jgi:hypothetical protein
MNHRVEALLAREVTRKQFIATLGMAVVSIFGFSTLFGVLTTTESKLSDAGRGFGSGTFGS